MLLYLIINYIGWRVFLGRIPETHEAIGMGIMVAALFLYIYFEKEREVSDD